MNESPDRSRPRATTRVLFVIPPHVHLQDLAGPAQVFYEANQFGANYALRYCASRQQIRSAQGLSLADLGEPPQAGPNDVVVAVGFDSARLDEIDPIPTDWLRAARGAGARLSSICSGAFLLGHAGILDGRECTTHWKLTDELAARFPAARVVRNRLYVKDGELTTSAGVTSGVDMALSMVEEQHGPIVAARVAREMVIYVRRTGDSIQTTAFLRYRTHLHPGVHRVQDWLTRHVEMNPTLEGLAQIAHMSPRNLTRVFKQATGVTLKEYSTRLKLEIAAMLLRNRQLTLEHVAAECGFKDPRQLRRLWTQNYGVSPSCWRNQSEERSSA